MNRMRVTVLEFAKGVRYNIRSEAEDIGVGCAYRRCCARFAWGIIESSGGVLGHTGVSLLEHRI